MKTKELIKLLQQEDPSGEEEVCIDNQPVWYVQRMPAYYDGTLVRYEPPLLSDSSYLCPEKIHFITEGVKIDIMYCNWKNIVWDSDGEVELGECSSDYLKKKFEEERVKAIDFKEGYAERKKTMEKINTRRERNV